MTLSLDAGSLSQAYATGTLSPADVINEIFDRIAVRGALPV